MYSQKSLDGYFYKAKGFYVFHIPVKVPYKQIYGMADAAGLIKKQTYGPILEKGKMLGYGWIGVEVEKPAESRDDVVHITGEFRMHLHKGPYRTLGQACQKISKEVPEIQELFFLYLDDPEKTKPEDCRTEILFR